MKAKLPEKVITSSIGQMLQTTVSDAHTQNQALTHIFTTLLLQIHCHVILLQAKV